MLVWLPRISGVRRSLEAQVGHEVAGAERVADEDAEGELRDVVEKYRPAPESRGVDPPMLEDHGSGGSRARKVGEAADLAGGRNLAGGRGPGSGENVRIPPASQTANNTRSGKRASGVLERRSSVKALVDMR